MLTFLSDLPQVSAPECDMIGQHFLQGVLATHGVPAYPGQMPPPPQQGHSAPQHHTTPSTNAAAQPTFIYQVSY